MLRTLEQAGFPRHKLVCIPSFYPVGPLPGAGERDNYLLYFGRLSRVKGLATLLRAHSELNHDTRLLLAGDDTQGYRAELERLADELGSADRVEFVGMKDRAELNALISRATAVVVPSEWPDNCPMSVFEAFALGTPVVASNIGGIPEQVRDGCGLLFEPGSVGELGQALQRMCTDRELRDRVRDRAFVRLRRELSPGTHTGQLLGNFQQLCRGGGTRG